VQCVVSESTYLAAKITMYSARSTGSSEGQDPAGHDLRIARWGRNESLYTERIVAVPEAITAYRRQQWDEASSCSRRLREKFPEAARRRHLSCVRTS